MKAKPSKHLGEVLLEVNQNDEKLLATASRAGELSAFRIKRILVPIDFSDCSCKALRYAIPLACQHQAELKLLYVVMRPNYLGTEYSGMDYAVLENDMLGSGEKHLKQLVRDEVPDDVPVTTQVAIGSPAVEIIEAARNFPADIIVISTHGRTGIKHILLGSVTEQVVRGAPCPVLVIPEHEQDLTIN